MKPAPLLNRASTSVLVAALAGLSLAACNRTPAANVQQAPPPTAALALANDPSAPPLADAPAANALPAAPPARVARLRRPDDDYAFADSGYAMSRAFADAPPDYTVDYDGVRPWIWRSDDDSVQVVEQVPGGDRYYYYRPGDDLPFLIRDPDYSYGFENGELVVVYDHAGRVMPEDYVQQRADWAGRYLARARGIYAAARSQQRLAVASANWRTRQSAIDADRRQWNDEQSQDDAWRAYHAAHDQYEQSQWDAERYRRQSEAARYAHQFNDTQGAARYAAAAAVALQASQTHRQGPAGGGQGEQQARTPFGGPQHGPGPAEARGPVPTGGAPTQPPFDQHAGDHQARQQQQAAQAAAAQNSAAQAAAQAQANRQAAAAQQARTQAAQAADQRQRADAANQERIAQAAQAQQARAQAAQQAAERQKAAGDAANQARAAREAQAQAQQQARAQAAQAAGERQRAAEAAAQARTAQQQAQAAQATAERQRAAEAGAQARTAQQAAAQRQAIAQQQQQARAQAQQRAAPPPREAAKPQAPAKPGEKRPKDADHQKQPQ